MDLSCGRRSYTHFSRRKRERKREREREAHIESGYPVPPLPATCYSPLMLPLVSHFHSPSTQCLDHGGIFPHLMTSVVIHSSWTAPPFHGLRRGQRSSLFQTRLFTYFACSLGGQHLPGFPSLPFRRPETQRTPKNSIQLLVPRIVSLPSQFPLSERAGVSAARPHIHLVCFFREALFFGVFCPRSLQTSMRLFGSWTKPTKSSIVFLPQVFLSHRSPGFPQILCTRIITRIPMPSLSSCTDSRHAGIIPFFPRDSAIIIAKPLLIPKFQPEVVEFLFRKLISIQIEITRPGFLLFPTDIFASHLINLSTTGHPSWTRAPRTVVHFPS